MVRRYEAQSLAGAMTDARTALFQWIADRYPTPAIARGGAPRALWKTLFYLIGPPAPFRMRTADYALWVDPRKRKDIARGILDRERAWGMAARVRPGPADGSIFDAHDDPDKTVAGDMATVGVRWEPADRSAGSRKNGWERVRQLLTDAVPRDGKREGPGLFACERCEQFRRLVPSTPRDERDPDDVDTDSEDHLLDEVRYRTRALRKSVGIGRFK